jgi:hypothetical protein
MQTLIDFMRENGVVHLKVHEFELELAPVEEAGDIVVTADANERPAPVAEEEPRRKDGLTKEQQIELYGCEMP